MHIDRQKSRSDAEFYQLKKQAEANKLLLTPEYLELTKYKSLTANSKIYFGPDIPHLFVHGTGHTPFTADSVQPVSPVQEAINIQDGPSS